MGVADIPNCMGTNTTLCTLMTELLGIGAYAPGVRDISVQAQYFKDPFKQETYLKDNIFLPDVNNEGAQKNHQYKANMLKLEKFVMTMFTEDTMVVPKESAHFRFFPWGSNQRSEILAFNETEIYKQDWIGLQQLDKEGKIDFLECQGNHLQFTLPWLDTEIIKKYLL